MSYVWITLQYIQYDYKVLFDAFCVSFPLVHHRWCVSILDAGRRFSQAGHFWAANAGRGNSVCCGFSYAVVTTSCNALNCQFCKLHTYCSSSFGKYLKHFKTSWSPCGTKAPCQEEARQEAEHRQEEALEAAERAQHAAEQALQELATRTDLHLHMVGRPHETSMHIIFQGWIFNLDYLTSVW